MLRKYFSRLFLVTTLKRVLLFLSRVIKSCFYGWRRKKKLGSLHHSREINSQRSYVFDINRPTFSKKSSDSSKDLSDFENQLYQEDEQYPEEINSQRSYIFDINRPTFSKKSSDSSENLPALENQLYQYEEAFLKFDPAFYQVTEIDQNNIELLNTYRKLLASIGRNKKALRKFKTSLYISPEDVHTLSSYGIMLAEIGLYEEAILIFKICNQRDFTYFHKVSKSHFKSIRKFIIYCHTLVSQGHNEKAFLNFQASLESKIQNIQLINAYGNALSLNEKHKEAFQEFEKSLEIDDENLSTLNCYGSALSRAGHHQEAFSKFEKSLQLNPMESWTLFAYSKALTDAGHHEEAITYFKKFLKTDRNLFWIWSYIVELSLGIYPKDADILTTRADILAKLGKYEEACEHYQKALELDSQNIKILNRYGSVLSILKKYKKAFEQFENSLKINLKDTSTLNGYGNTLVRAKNTNEAFLVLRNSLEINPKDIYTVDAFCKIITDTEAQEKAFILFEELLKIHPKSTLILRTYGGILARIGKHKQARSLFQKCLDIDPENIHVITIYANTLSEIGYHEEAFLQFHKLSNFKPHDVRTINNYANALASVERYEEAFCQFKKSLKFQPENVQTLISYGSALSNSGHHEEAFCQFKKSLKLEPRNVQAITQYGNALASNSHYKLAFQQFQISLSLDPENLWVLNNYGNALASSGRYQEAFQKFQQCLRIDSQDIITHLNFAHWLEYNGQYNSACQQLESLEISQLTPEYLTLFHLILGRLYYCLKDTKKGRQHIEYAIQTANNKDKAKFQAAQNLLATQPGSSEAIQLLQSISESSPRYHAAMKVIGLHGDSKTTFEHFSDQSSSLQATEMLYRSTYHKVINEIAVLKSIAYRLARNLAAEHPLINEIIQLLEDLLISIKEQRTSEKASLDAIPHGDYDAILNIVAETAHNIADHVNNQIFVIISKVRRTQRNIDLDEPQSQRLEKLLTQLQITQNALNELKAINESFQVKKQTFLVKNLFIKWQDDHNQGVINLDNARIYLEIKNPQTELNSDEEKLKSILNELIENSLKHNRDLDYFKIRIQSRNVISPRELSDQGISGQRHFVNITLRDQGKGIPADKKEWIFQPLHTTSLENEGSGLGLYIARQVIKSLGGYILEDGTPGKGARFKIFLPLFEV